MHESWRSLTANAVRYYSHIQKRQAHTHTHDCERKQRQFVIVDLTLALLLDGMLLRLQAFLLWWNLIWIYGFRSIDAKWLFRLPLTFCNVWNENYYAIVNHPVGAYCLDNNAAFLMSCGYILSTKGIDMMSSKHIAYHLQIPGCSISRHAVVTDRSGRMLQRQMILKIYNLEPIDGDHHHCIAAAASDIELF